MKPDFKKIEIDLSTKQISKKDWEEKFKQETGKSVEDFIWETMEKIAVKPLYTKDDLENLEHKDYFSGIPPFLRGPYSTMYVQRPWTVRQYAGFFYR